MVILAGNSKKLQREPNQDFTLEKYDKIYSEFSERVEQISHTEKIISYSLEKYPEWSTERHKVGKYRKVKTKVNKLNKILNPIVCFFKETFLKYKDSENTKSERIKKVHTMQTLLYTLQTLQGRCCVSVIVKQLRK